MRHKETSPVHIFPKIDPATGKRWSLADQGRAALKEICNALNSKHCADLRLWLRSWMEAWQASGPNLKKLYWNLPDTQRTALNRALRANWYPTSGANAELLLVPDYLALETLLTAPRVWVNGGGGKPRLTPEIEALCLFSLLTVLPECTKIAGPCPRCDRYYIKKRGSQKVYCSRRCGNASTAIVRTRERNAEKREEKLESAKTAMGRWSRTPTKQDWKHWVAMKTGIDLRFLTRAVNKGDLIQPEQEK